MDLRQMKIGSRLGAGFGLILLSASLLLAGALASSGRSRDYLLKTLDQASEQEAQANTMRLALLSSAVAVRNMGLLSKVEDVQKAQEEASKHRTEYLAVKTRLEAGSTDAADQALLKQLTDTDTQMNLHLKEAVDLASQFNTEQAAAVITAKIDPLLTKANADLATFVAHQHQRKTQALDDANRANQATQAMIIAAGLAVLAVAALLAWRMTRSIVQPLSEAVDAAARVASGDLSSPIHSPGRDEAALLLQALGHMQQSLARMVTEVREGTQTIDHAASEIAQGNADLSSRTESQASSLEETASSVEHLTGTVKQNAQNAMLANDLSEAAATQADKGQAVVGEVIATMSAIDESSRKIGDIISVINGIAFQTNILALNAAVEAARAGEQGRGFAVVASEVRTLSQRTTAASREIEALIRAAVDRSQAGSALVGRAGETMGDVLSSVRKVAQIVGEISAASRDQTNGIEEVNRAISDIDRSTQQNAALVEQAAAAAESMRSQSNRLSGLVSAFRVPAH
ncbi:methyl-accepting chemotaxis protein [Ideonella sp.]|uniref:methyl-accepting chemotaxis protein n=1 Tax=Ideonella sp. TaxID=1929293 RepID=UPI003BB701CB